MNENQDRCEKFNSNRLKWKIKFEEIFSSDNSVRIPSVEERCKAEGCLLVGNHCQQRYYDINLDEEKQEDIVKVEDLTNSTSQKLISFIQDGFYVIIQAI